MRLVSGILVVLLMGFTLGARADEKPAPDKQVVDKPAVSSDATDGSTPAERVQELMQATHGAAAAVAGGDECFACMQACPHKTRDLKDCDRGCPEKCNIDSLRQALIKANTLLLKCPAQPAKKSRKSKRHVSG